MKKDKMNNKRTYVGNCSNIFDEKTGKCKLDIFLDVSDFAHKDENAIEISKDDFYACVIVPEEIEEEIIAHDLKYLFYEGNVWVLYDTNDDMHYFFN